MYEHERIIRESLSLFNVHESIGMNERLSQKINTSKAEYIFTNRVLSPYFEQYNPKQ